LIRNALLDLTPGEARVTHLLTYRDRARPRSPRHGASAPFTVSGLLIAKNVALVEAGFDLAIGKSATLGPKLSHLSPLVFAWSCASSQPLNAPMIGVS